MTTGSLCFTEILKSWKSCSSKRPGLPDRRLDQRLGRGLAVLLEQPRVERAGVDADPDRGAAVLGRGRDLLDLVVELADVARVDPDGGAAGVDRGEDVLRLEVDVGDHRDLRVLRDLRQRVGVVLARAGDPDDVAAGRGQLGDLLEGGVDVRGQGGGHRLHRDRRLAADPDLADLDLPGLAARREHRRGCRGHAQADLGHGASVRRDAALAIVGAGRQVRLHGHDDVARRSAPGSARAGTTRRRRRPAAAWPRRRSRGPGGRAAGRTRGGPPPTARWRCGRRRAAAAG